MDNSKAYITSPPVYARFLRRVFHPWRFSGHLRQWGLGRGLPRAGVGGGLGSQSRPSTNLGPPSPAHAVPDWWCRGPEEQGERDGVSRGAGWQGWGEQLRQLRATGSAAKHAAPDHREPAVSVKEGKYAPTEGAMREAIPSLTREGVRGCKWWGNNALVACWKAGRGQTRQGLQYLLLQKGEAGRRHDAPMGWGSRGSQRGSQKKSHVFSSPKAG